MSKIDCILYPPTVEYDYMLQRPQQLMKSFSEMNIPSYYMNINLFKKQRGIRQINPYFFVFNDVNIKPYLRNSRPVIYFSLPDHINIIKQYNPAMVIFDSIDEPSDEFAIWRNHYHRALELADIVLATSEKLYKMASRVNPDTHLLPNACDFEYFSQAYYKSFPWPEDIKNIRGPVIGFMGAVATWCDLELLDRLAVNFPHCNIVIVGPLYNVSSGQLPLRNNIHYLGIKPYEQVAAYVQAFDVGIIPFKLSSMIESVNPIKMWEYMATGIPIVTTAFPEAKKYQDVLFYSANEKEFMENIELALSGDSAEKQAQRLDLARQNSWRYRAEQIIQIVEDRLAEKTYPFQQGFKQISTASSKKDSRISRNYVPYAVLPSPPKRLTIGERKAITFATTLAKDNGQSVLNTVKHPGVKVPSAFTKPISKVAIRNHI